MKAAIYARVSTADQHCELQLAELRAYCSRMNWEAVEYVEKASGSAGKSRPELERLMKDAQLRRFDVVLVWKLDRFGRSLQEFVQRVMQLDSRGIAFVALTQGIDTDKRNPAAKLLMHILAAMAEFERDLISERTKAGMAAAKAKGTRLGRPGRIWRRDLVLEMRNRGMSWRAIAREVGVPQSSIRTVLKGRSGVRKRLS